MPVSRRTCTHVLLVDSDASVRRALARSMRLAGFSVETFATVEALLACEASVQDACLVLDVDLPGIGGIAFKEMLIASGHDRPTIFLSSSGHERLDARLHPVAVLQKPFTSEKLLETLARAMASD